MASTRIQHKKHIYTKQNSILLYNIVRAVAHAQLNTNFDVLGFDHSLELVIFHYFIDLGLSRGDPITLFRL